MRNPYIVGSWVRGHHHYGREGLIDHLLHSPVDAVWVIGNRRVGKTSLLHHLEYLTQSDDTYTPLFWDMSGRTTFADLSTGLVYDIEDVAERFRELGVDPAELRGQDLTDVLRILRRQARSAGRKVLLLCDEVEVLIPAGQRDPERLALLRAAFQRGEGLRVIIASTKALSHLNDFCREEWETSPFLFGFGLRNLFGLDRKASEALIHQAQGKQKVDAAPELVQEIRQHTNDHPSLIQYLCQRLFEKEGYLRPIRLPDLVPDAMLNDYFKVDYRLLCAGERAILRQVAAHGAVDEAELQRATGIDLLRLRNFLFGLTKLDYLREQDGGWTAGNTFFGYWLRANRHLLAEMPPSAVSDQTTQEMLVMGQKQEVEYLKELLQVNERNLRELEMQRASYGLDVPLHLMHQIEHVHTQIASITRNLDKLGVVEA